MREQKGDAATLAVDIGNTNITCGIYQSGTLTWFARFYSSHNRTADEYYALLPPLWSDIRQENIAFIALASVVP